MHFCLCKDKEDNPDALRRVISMSPIALRFYIGGIGCLSETLKITIFQCLGCAVSLEHLDLTLSCTILKALVLPPCCLVGLTSLRSSTLCIRYDAPLGPSQSLKTALDTRLSSKLINASAPLQFHFRVEAVKSYYITSEDINEFVGAFIALPRVDKFSFFVNGTWFNCMDGFLFGQQGICHLSRFIVNGLKNLDLSMRGCHLSERDACTIASLTKNTSLTRVRLDLGWNECGRAGIQHLSHFRTLPNLTDFALDLQHDKNINCNETSLWKTSELRESGSSVHFLDTNVRSTNLFFVDRQFYHAVCPHTVTTLKLDFSGNTSLDGRLFELQHLTSLGWITLHLSNCNLGRAGGLMNGL